MARFNFFSELKKKFEVSDLGSFCQLVMMDFSSLYIEGVSDILSIGSEEIDIRLKKMKMRICGEGLEVVELGDKVVLIRGNIVGVNKI